MFEQKDMEHHINEKRLQAVPEITDQIYYFIGCTEKTYPGINNAFIEICKIIGNEPITSNKQSCCAGNFIAFNTAPLETVVALTQRNYNLIKEYAHSCVTTCNGCFSSFHNCNAWAEHSSDIKKKVKGILEKLDKDYIEDIGVFHVGEYLYKHRKLLPQYAKHNLENVKIAVHYGCHFLHQEDQGVIIDDIENPTIIEEILNELKADIVNYKEKALCCGAGLNQRVLKDDRMNALEITLKKMRSIGKHKPDAIVVVCPYCELHLDNSQFELEVEFDEDFDIPVLHLTELLGILFELPEAVLKLDNHKISVDDFLEKVNYHGQMG